MYCVFDLETAGKTTYKRFCNPLDSSHKIIISATKTPRMAAQTRYNEIEYANGILPGECFDNVDLSAIKMIVGHNLKFDLLWIWGWSGFQDWIANGGRIWDTQVAQYLLDGQSREKRSLDTLAQKYGGVLKDDRIGKMFKEGITADNIDPELILPYARGDVENTEIVFLKQNKLAKEQHMIPLMQGYMEHYLALCEMEFNGMYVDKEQAMKLTHEYRKTIKVTHKKIDDLKVSFGWPETVIFNPGSLEHVSTMLFGGSVPHLSDIPVLDEYGNQQVYKSGARVGQVKTRKEKVFAEVEGLGISTINIPRAKKEGFYRADDKIMKSIKQKNKDKNVDNILGTVMEYRKLQKVLKTYLLHEEHNAKGELKKSSGFIPMIHPHSGAVHSEFKPALTRTGRLASRNPNVQNIAPSVLSIFSSRFGDEGILVELDFSQLEVVIQAYLTQSPNFIRDIKNGVDFHCKRLSYLVDMPYEEVKSLCDTSAEWKQKRKKAKAVSFQKAYGAQPASIALSTGLKEEEIKKIFDREDAEYPEIQAYYEMVTDEVKQTSVPTNYQINIRDKSTGNSFKRDGEIQHVGSFRSITQKRYTFLENAVLCRNKRIFRYYSAPEIQDYLVQGLAADNVSCQVGRLFRALLKHRDKALIVNEIHDAVLLDIKKEHYDLIVSKTKRILEDIPGTFKKYFGIDWNVPISVDVESGINWEKVKSGEE